MADGAAVAYRIWKPGPSRRLLALLHGVASNMTRWSEFMAHTSLGESWDLLRLDLRGHGLSLYRGRLDMGVWCDDLSAIIRAEGYADVVIAGHCFGADIGAEFAVRRPGETAGLILIESRLSSYYRDLHVPAVPHRGHRAHAGTGGDSRAHARAPHHERGIHRSGRDQPGPRDAAGFADHPPRGAPLDSHRA